MPLAPRRPRWTFDEGATINVAGPETVTIRQIAEVIGDELGHRAAHSTNVAEQPDFVASIDRMSRCWELPRRHPARVWRGWWRPAEAVAVRHTSSASASRPLVYGLGAVAAQILGVITLPIYARVFDPSEYGVIEVITVGLAVLAIVVDFGLGFGSSAIVFRLHRRDVEERRVVLSTVIGSVA